MKVITRDGNRKQALRMCRFEIGHQPSLLIYLNSKKIYIYIYSVKSFKSEWRKEKISNFSQVVLYG